MSHGVRTLFPAGSICAAWMIVLCLSQPRVAAKTPQPEKQAASKSVARFATDDFFAGCLVRPKGLIASPLFGSLPLYIFVPDPISLGRFETMGVEELAVFCAAPDERQSKPGRPAAIRWAAAARMAKDVDLEAVMSQWRRSLAPQDREPLVKPVAMEIDGRKCFRVPAGSFLEAPRTCGTLRFTDREGKPADEGINIGRIYPRRSYVVGATRASAIFTFDHVDESDLMDRALPLVICPDAFRMRFLEYGEAQIVLRNPDTGLCSEPITFQPESYVNQRLDIPRKVTAADAGGKRAVDLLKDLVANGRIEVILKPIDPDVIIGVGPDDVYLRRRAFEYVLVSGREIVVAQSPEALQQMLRAARSPVALADRLAQPADDIVVVANLSDPSRRSAFQHLVSGIGAELEVDLLRDEWTAMMLEVTAHPAIVGQLTVSFSRLENANQAASHFNQFLRFATAQAHTHIKHLLGRGDTAGMLSSMYGGVSRRFPSDGPATRPAREAHLLSMIDDALDNVQIDTRDKQLAVRFKEPAGLGQLPELAQVAIANIEEALARDAFERDRYDVSDEMYRRATDRFPHVPQLWFRRAHQFAYNTPPRFTAFEDRYAWVRRGVMILLDGAEQNRDRAELTWEAARFIGWKIGASDEHAAYRKLFSQDKELHQRLARFINLEKARGEDKSIDNWLVAKLLFQHAVDQPQLPKPSVILPLRFSENLPASQAEYAKMLTELGHWNEARLAWNEAERLHHELGQRSIVLGDGQSIRLDEYKDRLAKSGPNDPTVKLLKTGRELTNYDYWLARCQLEQTDTMQLARKFMREAAEDARQGNSKLASELYRKSLEALAEVHKQHPEQMAVVAGDFKPVVEGYRKAAAGASAGPEQQSVVAIVKLIEETKRNSRNPFFDVLDEKKKEAPPAK